MVTPAGRKSIATLLITVFRICERRACKLAGISRTGLRYQATPPGDEVLKARLMVLVAKHGGLGCRLLHGMLRNEGIVRNHKRTEHVYAQERFQLRTRNRKKLKRPRMPMVVPIACNVRWSMDFVSDQLSNHRRFRILNMKDDYSKELIGQLVAYSISGAMVGRFLDQLIEQRGAPEQITCDNGTEFTSKRCSFGKRNPG